jgi:NAD(P)-dependent dehydrogenase (short-subunit alcohol dehydrogenase family)
MDMGLRGKTVIVTGASSNIGRGILLGFAAEGARLVAANRDVVAGGAAVDEANRLGGEAICIKTDVTDLASVEAMVEQTLERFGRIDVLVNNAGGIPGEGKFIDKSREDWAKEIDLNYWGVIHCTRAVLDSMIAGGGGRIVNITSGSAIKGSGAVNHAVYAGTKAGVNGLTRALAWELGRYNIGVNAASPGWIVPDDPSHTSEGSFWQQWGFDSYTPEKLEAFKNYWPIRRLGRPADMANAVVFLASERASFITGQILEIDGGATS